MMSVLCDVMYVVKNNGAAYPTVNVVASLKTSGAAYPRYSSMANSMSSCQAFFKEWRRGVSALPVPKHREIKDERCGKEFLHRISQKISVTVRKGLFHPEY